MSRSIERRPAIVPTDRQAVARRCCDVRRQARPTTVSPKRQKSASPVGNGKTYTCFLRVIYKAFILKYTIVILRLPAPDR